LCLRCVRESPTLKFDGFKEMVRISKVEPLHISTPHARVDASILIQGRRDEGEDPDDFFHVRFRLHEPPFNV